MASHHCIILMFITLFNVGVIFSKNGEKVIVNKENLVKKSTVEVKENQRSPLSHTLDSLLQGMELAELKRSVDDEVANIKTEKKKEIQDWLKPKAMKPSDWLKEELDKMKENFGNTLSVSQIPDLLDLKKGATKLPDWLKSAPTKQPGESIDSNENVDGAILNELSNGDMIQVNKNEKKTVDHFIEALRQVADQETEMTIKKQSEPLKKRTMETTTKQCKDMQPDCQSYSFFCNTFKQQMEENCAHTCNFCKKDLKTCDSDIAENKRCVIIKQLGLCKQPTAEALCATTCVCENCANSLHGCCWDRRTLKEDQSGSNCPECKDKYHSSVCERFQKDCSSTNEGAKNWMKQNCMRTCQYCSDNESNNKATNQKPKFQQQETGCKDAESQKDFCPIWKNAKWCEEKQDIMEKLCPKTCYDCNLTDHSRSGNY